MAGLAWVFIACQASTVHHTPTLLDEPAREALRQSSAELDIAERQGEPAAIARALGGLGRAYAALQAWGPAETHFDAALRWSRPAGGIDALVELLCERGLAAAHRARRQDADEPGSGHAARERARDAAFEASALSGRVADPGWEAHALLRVSDVLEACGDRGDALQVQVRALRLVTTGQLQAPIGLDATPPPHTGRHADA